MFGPVTTASLDRVLAVVSRSVYLTLKVAPRSVRRQLGTAYLFCRAADTIADTRLLPTEERLEHLKAFRAQFEDRGPRAEDLRELVRRIGGPSSLPEERELLERLEECFALLVVFSREDRALICRLVRTLTQGMEMDLERFPREDGAPATSGHPAAVSSDVVALQNDEELDRYCYYVAGCVGEFWTDLQLLHVRALRGWDVEEMRAKGVRFGKGLQMTNVLRDVDRDLALGRCYLPLERVAVTGRTPEEVRDAGDRSFVRPVIRDLLLVTLDHYRAGWEYTLAIPRRVVSLRLACAWMLLIGLRTCELLATAEDPCAPGIVCKISRREVHRLLRVSTARALSNRALGRLYGALEAPVRKALSEGTP